MSKLVKKCAQFVEEPLMSEPRRRPWPYFAENARDLSAEDAVAIIRILEPFFQDVQLTPEQVRKRIGQVYAKSHNIAARLKEQGARIDL